MRLHTLAVTAFGPFADSVEVDFESLSDAGLFLLCGATGAGKSSILDAVCFALYGEVPGDRRSARHLRCDTATPGLAPTVFLDVTLNGRRFHLQRSPAWQRPKKRGAGTTSQQASVLVQEVVDGHPVHLTSRLDEAGQLISGLLGMNLTQFTQVAMLPQGHFQDFLRARSEDRHLLLQKLFRTRRFEDVERWLRERRLVLQRESQATSEKIIRLLHRLDEVSGEALPLSVDDLLLPDATESGWLSEAVGVAVLAATTAVEETASTLALAAQASVTADAALREAQQVHEAQRRHREATRRLAELDASAEAAARARETLDRARRAAPVEALHAQVLRRRGRLAETETAAHATHLKVHELLGVWLDDDEWDERRARAQESLLGARGLVTVEAELTTLRRRAGALDHDLAAVTTALTAAEAELGSLPTTVAAAAERAAITQAAGHELPAASAVVERLTARREAYARVSDLSTAYDQARDHWRESVDAHQHLREVWLQLHEERIHGMAAELAIGLAVGATCPVCGSCDHPHPATAATGAPTPSAEKAARRSAEDADAVRQAHAERVRSLELSLSVAREQAGPTDLPHLEVELQAALERRDVLSLTAAAHETACREEADARARLAAAQAASAAAQVDHSALQASRQALDEQIEALAATLSDALDGVPDVPSLIAERSRIESGLRAADDARRARDDEAAQLAELLDDLAREAARCAFDDPQEAIAAVRSPGEVAELDRRLTERDIAIATARSALDDSEVVAALDSPAPDLVALERDLRGARSALTDAEAAHRRAQEVAVRVRDLDAQLADELAAWAPIRDRHDLVSRVCGFVEGKSPDNRAQMRLSAYVLSWRLGQVVDAANLRLSRMTDQRYSLEHTSQRGAGESRGGLSLRIRDEWSGESRDPVTLSGGETFVVSLALALGLTDVVTQEAGGADIGTLFVDEGFGSLDADTLDDVMDTLDALREGGRVVGIVSHVPELRTRVTAQLHVAKSRTGSTVRQVRALA
ncbi:putative exonuclease [metagenome]|uniref:Putative exonuclease n=1 Tax=metagenome TaxID=256318 RepID=A0A2P2CDP6_9ZZZZ